LIKASRRNGKPKYEAGIENGVEKSTPFFCVDDLAEKGFFYSVNVKVSGGAWLYRAASAGPQSWTSASRQGVR
jgi:hypothetical protein